MLSNLRGNCTPNQKKATVVLYLKIINTFLKNKYMHGTQKWCWNLRGNCTPNQKLASVMFYLKIINTFLKNNICMELKNGVEILVGQAALKLWINTVKILFWSVTQELLALLFNAIFEFLGWFTMFI